MQETGPPRKNREGLRFIQRFYWRCKKNLRTLIPVLMIGIGVAFIYLAIYGSISFLGQNQNRSTRSDETHGQQIGSVKKFAGQTRKRMNNGFIWEEVRERDAAISNGDAVFTDSNSNVTLELSRVGELEVGENSLVVVDHTLNEEQVSLKIEQGKIKIRSLPSGKKIRIRSRGEVFEVQAKTADTDLSIDVGSDDSSNQVHFTSTRPDSIQVSDPRNEDRTKIVAAETPGNAPVDPPVVEIVGATAHSDPDGKISYQVSVQLKVKTRASAQYEIELFSRDRSLGKYRVVDDRYSLDLDSSGRYSIRARSLSSSGIIGAWSEPTIANVQPVPPIALDAKVTSSGPSPWVELTWKSQDKKVSEYVLKVWKGKQLFADRKIASESVILPVSEGADYQYTVASVDSESLISEESQPGQFSVKRLDTPQSEVESTPNAFDFAFGIMQMNYQ